MKMAHKLSTIGCFNGNDMHFITFWILAHLYIVTALAKFLHKWMILIITTVNPIMLASFIVNVLNTYDILTSINFNDFINCDTIMTL